MNRSYSTISQLSTKRNSIAIGLSAFCQKPNAKHGRLGSAAPDNNLGLD